MIWLDPSWRRVHLVGLGGAGMSAIARVLKEAGLEVSGSDVRESAALTSLRALGVRADVGHRAEQAEGADLIVVSNAIGEGNPEVERGRAAGTQVLLRGQVLGQMIRNLRSIAVSGAHGKTTTSGMVATILSHAGADPTWLLGSDLQGRGSGGRLGEGELAVVEADEAYGSFLWLQPSVAVVTNIDLDHVDHYDGWEALQSAFSTFAERASEAVIICADDPRAVAVTAGLRPFTYGFAEGSDLRASELDMGAGGTSFEMLLRGRGAGRVNLQVGGRHNVQNALGAAAAALQVGLEMDEVRAGLEAFEGVSRRFERRGRFQGADLVDDYAHHPAEVRATLAAASGGPWSRVIAVFQPHLYSRTRALWREFGEALALADIVVVTDVYGAREDPIPGVTGKLVVEAACDAAPGCRIAYMPRLGEAARYLAGLVREGDLVLGLGAGDITTLPDRLTRILPADW